MRTTRRHGWGTKTAWSSAHFDMVPPEDDDAARTDAAPTSSPSPVAPTAAAAAAAASRGRLDKLRRRQELDLRTRWRCRRCGLVLQPPPDAATGKPRTGVMMAEHLEGISSGGTPHLATGVAVCAAGVLRFQKLSDADDGAPSGAQERKRQRSGTAEDDGTVAEVPRQASGGDAAAATAAARDAVRRLLRECQEAARRRAGATAAPAPLLFLVVENPKTPANAGGILRAMRCYGVCGPAAAEVPPVVSTDTVVVGGGGGGGGGGADGGGLRYRVGAFLFSGTRLRTAMEHTEHARTLRTDPAHAGRDIPQLCVPSLDVLFDVLREEYGHRRRGSHEAPPTPAVRVVAVELVEGATLLPTYEHPFSRPAEAPTASPPEQSSACVTVGGADSATAHAPMVFYVLGAEDGTLSAHHVQRDVDDVVFMPTAGSMNLAATVNVLLYDRCAKECCGVQPALTSDTAAPQTSSPSLPSPSAWKDVFDTRNANNRTRWTRAAP